MTQHINVVLVLVLSRQAKMKITSVPAVVTKAPPTPTKAVAIAMPKHKAALSSLFKGQTHHQHQSVQPAFDRNPAADILCGIVDVEFDLFVAMTVALCGVNIRIAMNMNMNKNKNMTTKREAVRLEKKT